MKPGNWFSDRDGMVAMNKLFKPIQHILMITHILCKDKIYGIKNFLTKYKYIVARSKHSAGLLDMQESYAVVKN